MNYLKEGIHLAGLFILMLVVGCTKLNMTQNEKPLINNINLKESQLMQSTTPQQEAIIKLIQETIAMVQHEVVIGKSTQLLGKNHESFNRALEDAENRAYRFIYGKPNNEKSFSPISVILYTAKNANKEYETDRAVIKISSGAYKTNFPNDIFTQRIGLIRYREYKERGVRPSASFPNAMYGHWMDGSAYFVYPYLTTEKPTIAVVAMIVESGNGGDINKQTVLGDINMDHPLNIESIEIYVK